MFWKKYKVKEIMEIFLTHLKPLESAIVKDILGGPSVIERLNALGIRNGRKITKLSQHFWHGPTTISIGKSKVAIGRGMAKKILVELVI